MAKVRIVLVSVVVLLLSATIASANVDDDWDACDSDGWDYSNNEIIKGCTNIINSGSFNRIEGAYIYYHRGQAYLDNNEYNRAIADLNKTIKMEPGAWRAYLGRADAYEAIGEYDKANTDRYKGKTVKGPSLMR